MSSSGASSPLAGRHAIVTGGGKGIGAAIAWDLARLGADVTIMGRDESALRDHANSVAEEHGVTANPVAADVTAQESVARAFATAAKQLGAPHILVNNAGAVETAPFVDTEPRVWHDMLAVNLTSVFLCTRAVLPAMLVAGEGRVVNIASTAGLEGFPYVTAYAAAKHGVVGLTRALALECKGKGVTVNAVCPGYTDTDLVERSAQKVAAKTGEAAAAVKEKLARANASGRLVQPEEVAALVSWLCRDEQASVTGEAIVVDGTSRTSDGA